MSPERLRAEQIDHLAEHPVPYELLRDELAEEAIETLEYYIGRAQILSSYREELAARNPEGEYLITPWFLARYMTHASWLQDIGIEPRKVTESSPIQASNGAVVGLLERQITQYVGEGNSEVDLIVQEGERYMAASILGEYWPDDQLAGYAGCNREEWDRMNFAEKWRAVALVSNDFDLVKGRPNYFRYHSPESGERPVAIRPASGPYIDTGRFLEREADPHQAGSVAGGTADF